MDKQRSLELLAGGVEQWNIWARIRQSERDGLRLRGLWREGDNECNEETRHWHKESDVNVPGDRFGIPIDYSGYIFPGNVQFSDATFANDVRFSRAVFEGDALFTGVTFQGEADFGGATFHGSANFERARVSSRAMFSEVNFGDVANFARAKFELGSWFENAKFVGRAAFENAKFFEGSDFAGSCFLDAVSFKASEFTRKAKFEKVKFGKAVDFQNAIFGGSANFERAELKDVAQFALVVFEGEARFKGVSFSGLCSRAGGALFSNAIFKKAARFDNVTFFGSSVFAGATFSGDAWFADSRFVGDAGFLQAVFGGFTSFDRAKFEKEAAFRAIDAKSVFSLAGTEFQSVPDFVQSHFVEAPRLDNSRIESQRSRQEVESDGTTVARRNPDLAARWRNLKRLAVLGHDHAREQAFFKGEMEARRGSEDKIWHGVYFFGVLFAWFSDYGRSIWRPFFWWVGSIVLFAGVHLYSHLAVATGSPYPSSILRRLVGIASNEQTFTCVAGQGDPLWAAFLLSAQKAVLVFGAIPLNKLNQMYSCLYGTHLPDDPASQNLPERLSPIIPDPITALGILQYLVSAALVFLLLLAIRNHFRIK